MTFKREQKHESTFLPGKPNNTFVMIRSPKFSIPARALKEVVRGTCENISRSRDYVFVFLRAKIFRRLAVVWFYNTVICVCFVLLFVVE